MAGLRSWVWWPITLGLAVLPMWSASFTLTIGLTGCYWHRILDLDIKIWRNYSKLKAWFSSPFKSMICNGWMRCKLFRLNSWVTLIPFSTCFCVVLIGLDAAYDFVFVGFDLEKGKQFSSPTFCSKKFIQNLRPTYVCMSRSEPLFEM